MDNKTQIVDSINSLHEALTKEYGLNFSYSILANGHIIAASNVKDGCISPSLQRLYSPHKPKQT